MSDVVLVWCTLRLLCVSADPGVWVVGWVTEGLGWVWALKVGVFFVCYGCICA